MFVFIYLSISLSLHRPLREFSILLNASEGQLAFYLYLFICFCNGKWWKSLVAENDGETWCQQKPRNTSSLEWHLSKAGTRGSSLTNSHRSSVYCIILCCTHISPLHHQWPIPKAAEPTNPQRKDRTLTRCNKKCINMFGTRIGKGS